MFEIKKLDPILDEDILYKIVEMENLLFGDASIGNYNIKPMAKYGKVYVILNGADIVSVIEVMSSFNRELAYIYGVCTNAPYQNKGMANKLLFYVLEDLKNYGIKKVQLTVGINNIIAQKLYSKFNFKIKEKLKNEYRDGEERYLYESLLY